MITAAVSATEVRYVQDGVTNDVREDGRTLLQRRPVSIRTNILNTAEIDTHNGGSVEVKIGDTTVMAAASPSVVEVSAAGAEEDCDSKEEEQQGQGMKDDQGSGELCISIDAVPAVTDFYANALGGRGASGRYRRDYMAYVALSMRHVFGAQSVTVQEQEGVAEAQLVGDDENEKGDDDDNEGGGDAADVKEGGSNSLSRVGGGGVGCGFPGKDLYIGGGYAFRVDVDVHILQAGGGNVLSCAALAVHYALKTMRLPEVTLHETTSGVSVEVDRSKPFSRTVDWSQLPVLCVMHVSPTRHYVVDATQTEELALPQQLHVAANALGQVCFTRYQQLPSRRGNAYCLGGSAGDSRRHDRKRLRAPGEEDGSGTVAATSTATAAGAATIASSVNADYFDFNYVDWVAMVGDAVHVCHTMVSECDDIIHSNIE